MSLPHAEVCLPLARADGAAFVPDGRPLTVGLDADGDDAGPVFAWLIQDEGFADIDTQAAGRPHLAVAWRRPPSTRLSRRVSVPEPRGLSSCGAG